MIVHINCITFDIKMWRDTPLTPSMTGNGYSLIRSIDPILGPQKWGQGGGHFLAKRKRSVLVWCYTNMHFTVFWARIHQKCAPNCAKLVHKSQTPKFSNFWGGTSPSDTPLCALCAHVVHFSEIKSVLIPHYWQQLMVSLL